jgi:hypothetical protein
MAPLTAERATGASPVKVRSLAQRLSAIQRR